MSELKRAKTMAGVCLVAFMLCMIVGAFMLNTAVGVFALGICFFLYGLGAHLLAKDMEKDGKKDEEAA